MPANRITEHFAPSITGQNGWLWKDGRWHHGLHTVRLDPPDAELDDAFDFDQRLRDWVKGSDSLELPPEGWGKDGCDGAA